MHHRTGRIVRRLAAASPGGRLSRGVDIRFDAFAGTRMVRNLEPGLTGRWRGCSRRLSHGFAVKEPAAAIFRLSSSWSPMPLHQNTSLAPNCKMRAAAADVIVPNVELLFKPFEPGTNEVFGMPRFTRFVMLIASARICS